MCLVGLLEHATGLEGAVESLEDVIVLNDGIQLLTAIGDYLAPPTPMDIVQALSALGNCTQRNGESMDAFDARINKIWLRIKRLVYDSFDNL